jgi:hypothetical protein
LGLLVAATGTALASTVIGLTIEDQARLSSYVALGEVTALRGVDHPANGLETEVTLRVERIWKGGARPGETVVFHTRSGEANGEVSRAVGEVDLRVGQRILVFVESIDGRPYNLGLSYGVFEAIEDRQGRLAFRRSVADGLEIVGGDEVGDGPFSVEEVTAKIAWAATHPRFDNPMVRDAFGQGR